MNQKISIKKIEITALAVIIIITGVFIWRSKGEINWLVAQRKQQATQLMDVEVKEYNGGKLSPISDVADEGIKGVQNIDVKNYSLQITGLVSQPKSFTYDQVLQLPKYSKVVNLKCVEGWNANILWEGVLVKDLINEAGPQAGANTVIFYAQDGYTTSLSLDYINNNNIILADKMNGIVLPAAKGFPFQLVAEQKWGYKWIKWVTKIELSSDPNYKGYWENRGFSNSGDLNNNFLNK